MAKNKNKKFKTTIHIELDGDMVAKAFGKAMRENYLADNPHGFTVTTKKHKNKKKYNRKNKKDFW